MKTLINMDEKGKGGGDIMTPTPLLDIRPQSLSFCPYGRSLWLYNPSSTSSGKDVIATLSILPPPSQRGVGGDQATLPPALHLEGPFFEYSEDCGLLKVESGSQVEVRASVSPATDLGDGKYCSAITGAIVVNYEEGQETVVPVIFEPQGALEDKDEHIHALTEEVARLKRGMRELMLKNENHPNLFEEWQQHQARQKKTLQFSSCIEFTPAAVEEKRVSDDTLDAVPQTYLAAQAWWLHLAYSNVNPIDASDVCREQPQQLVPREQTQTSGGGDGIGVVETDSNRHLCQQIQQLALDLSLSRQMALEADIKARNTAWEQEERLAAATLRIMALEAELRARDSQCNAQRAVLDEESSAEIREEAQICRAEFEQARYVKLKKRTETLVNELDSLKIASTVNVMEGPIKVTPRMILESFVGVMRKQSERIAELENKMDRNLVMQGNKKNVTDGSSIVAYGTTALMGKDASVMDRESRAHLLGELLAEQQSHAAALEAMQALQCELSKEARTLREKNVELEGRVEVEIVGAEDARSALKSSNAKCAELENQVLQANQKLTSQLTADSIALEEMSQAHKGVVQALKQSLMAVKAKSMINTATLAKRAQFVPDVKDKEQKCPYCGLCDQRSEVSTLRSILAQSNTMLGELQIQLRVAKEESKVATAQLEVALRRLSALVSTYEFKSEDLLLPSVELEKEQHIHLQGQVGSSIFQNNCMLKSILQATKLEILEAQCEEQRLLLNSMEEDLILSKQKLELQEKWMDESDHLSNDNIKILKPSLPSSSSAGDSHFCNVSEDEKEQQRTTTTTTQAKLSKLKELILQQANACPSPDNDPCSKEKELERLKISLAKQKAEANRKGKALAALREVKAVNETEFIELKEKLKTFEGKLTQCHSRLDAKIKLVAHLKKQREELQTEVDELRRSSLRSTEERNAITTTSKECDRLRSQLTMYRAKVKSLSKTVELSQINEASVRAAEEHSNQSEARSVELKREVTRRRQDVMMWKERAEEYRMDAEQLRNVLDLLKNNQKPPEVAVTSSHTTTANLDALIDSLKSSLIEGVRSYARAGRMRILDKSRTEIPSNRLAVAAAMDTDVTGQRHQHGLDSNIVSSMLGVTLHEAAEMMRCTSEDDDVDEFDWVSRAQCALLQWDGNMFWEVVREISRVRQPDGGGVLGTSEEESNLVSSLTGDKASNALLVDDERGMVDEWEQCLRCAKEILSS